MTNQATEAQKQIDTLCAISEDDSTCNSKAYKKLYSYFEQVKIPALMQHIAFINAFISDMATEQQRLSELEGYGYSVIDTDEIQQRITSLQDTNSDLWDWIDEYGDDNPEAAADVSDTISENNAEIKKLQELLEKARAYLGDGSIYSESLAQLERLDKATEAMDAVDYSSDWTVDLSAVDKSWIDAQLASDYMAARDKLALGGKPSDELQKVIDAARLGSYSTSCAYGGDPVNLATGNFVQELEFLRLKGDLPLALRLSYNSRSSASGRAGRGWRLGHEISVELRVDGANVKFGDGHDEFLYPSGEGEYSGSGEARPILRKTADGFELQQIGKATALFDPAGKIVRVLDNNGNANVFHYGENGLLEKIVNTSGDFIACQYNADGLLIFASDNVGRSVSLAYEDGLLTSVTDELGNTTTYGYRDGLLSRIVNAAGVVELTCDYAVDGRISLQTFSDGSTIEYAYDDEVGTITMTDQRGHVITFGRNNLMQTTSATDGRGTASTTYDEHGKLESFTDRSGHITNYHHDDKGNLTLVRYPDRTWRAMDYDEQGRVTRVELSGTEVRRNGYDEAGNIVEVTDGIGRKCTYTRDDAGRPILVVAPDGSETHLAYDERGNIAHIIDPLGNITSYVYDCMGNVVETTDGRGNKTEFFYDARGNITRVRDAAGNERHYTYDKLGNVTLIEDFDGTCIQREYDEMGHMVSSVDQRGNVTSYEYDSMGAMTARVSPRGARTEYGIDEYGNLVRVTDALGNTLLFEYDACGNRCKSIFPDGSFETADYDEMNRMVRAVATDGLTLTYTYDQFGLVHKISTVGGGTHLLFRDAAAQIVREVDEAGNETHFEYDALGNISRIVDPVGRETRWDYLLGGLLERVTYADGTWERYSYDACGNVVRAEQTSGLVVTYHYDDLNRVDVAETSTGQRIEYAYDAVGNVVSTVDATGAMTRFSYSPTGKLVEVIDALGNRTSYDYDACDDLVRVEQFPGETELRDAQSLNRQGEGVRWTAYERDALGRLVGMNRSAGNGETYSYTPLGQLASKIDGDGLLTEYSYTKGGLLEQVSYADGTSVALGYDTLRRLSLVRDQLGEMHFAHDQLGNVTEVTDELGNTVNYERGLLGECTSISYPDGQQARYAYDEVLRCSKAAMDDMEVNYAYDADGRLSGKTYSNGMSSAYSYTPIGNLAHLTISDAKGVVDDFAYAYDEVLNKVGIKSRRRGLPGESGDFSYTYDALGRLTGVSHDGSQVRSYEYDAFGNRIGSWERGERTNYEYNDAGQLIRRDGPAGAFDYAYDGRGNLTSVSQGEVVLRRYGYNARNRLAWAANENSMRTYEYNGLGQRIRENVFGTTVADLPLHGIDVSGAGSFGASPAQTIEYVLDTTKHYRNVLQEKHEDGFESYLWGDRFDLNFQADGEGERAILTDDLGSILRFANQQTGEVGGFAYDEFGMPSSSVGSTTAWAPRFGFAGYRWDETAGMYCAEAREYDPSLGRFAGRDVIKGFSSMPLSLNEYAYCWNNPLVFIDLDGRDITAARQGTDAHNTLEAYYTMRAPGRVAKEKWIPGGSSVHPGVNGGRTDIVYLREDGKAEIYDVKPLSHKPENDLNPYSKDWNQYNNYITQWNNNIYGSNRRYSEYEAVTGNALVTRYRPPQNYQSISDPNVHYNFSTDYEDGFIYYELSDDNDPQPEHATQPSEQEEKEREKVNGWEAAGGIAAAALLAIAAGLLYADDSTVIGVADDPAATAVATTSASLFAKYGCQFVTWLESLLPKVPVMPTLAPAS